MVLSELAQEYVHHIHRNTVRTASVEATIIQESVHTFLIQTRETVDKPGFHQTGPARFEDFDVPLITTGKHYYLYTEEEYSLTPKDLVCHTLLIHTGPRYQTYCLLLIEKQYIEPDELAAVAQRYGVEDHVAELQTEDRTEIQDDTVRQPDP